MKQTKLQIIISLLVGLGCFVISHSAKAEILELPLHQGNTPTVFSQGVSATLLSSDSSSVYMEVITVDTTIRVNIFPLDAQVQYRLRVSDKNLIANNPLVATGELVSREHRLILRTVSSDTALPSVGMPLTTATTTPVKSKETAIVPTVLKKYRTSDELVLSADSPVINISAEVNLRSYDNPGLQQISKAFDISNTKKLPLVGLLRYTYSGIGSQSVYEFDYSTLTWKSVPSYNDVKNDLVYFSTSSDNVTVAVFNSTVTSDGVASWYDQSRYKSFKYQGGNFTASRDYPKGTRLKVTRIKSGVSIVVTVNDYGPELRTKRLIDLEKKAFEQLASIGAGEIFVTIEKIDG